MDTKEKLELMTSIKSIAQNNKNLDNSLKKLISNNNVNNILKTVEETVDDVTETVEETVDDVTETVEETTQSSSNSNNYNYQVLSQYGLKFKNGQTQIVVELSSINPKLLEKLMTKGQIDAMSGSLVQMTLNIENLNEVMAMPGIDFIRTPVSITEVNKPIFYDIKSNYVVMIPDEEILSDLFHITIENDHKYEDNVSDYKQIEQKITKMEKKIVKELSKLEDQNSNDLVKSKVTYNLFKIYKNNKLDISSLDQSIKEEITKIIGNNGNDGVYTENGFSNKTPNNDYEKLQGESRSSEVNAESRSSEVNGNDLKNNQERLSSDNTKKTRSNSNSGFNYDSRSGTNFNFDKQIRLVEKDLSDNEQAKYEKLVQLANKLERISQLEHIIKEERMDHKVSEGVYTINADLVHTKGITGKDVKVAVLDLSFDLSNPKIADNVVDSKSFKGGANGLWIQQSHDGDESVAHGTAVAEIITDVAPDADLYLYEMDTDVEFVAAIDEAITNKVDVIAMAAGWPNLPTDGSSHITKKVEEAISHGIAFVVPSGNFAEKHWEGNFVDSNLNGWHEFDAHDEGMSISVSKSQVLAQQPIMVYLNWNNGLKDVTDFDLILLDPTGNIVDYSANIQKIQSDRNFESISFVPQIDGLYAIGISYAGNQYDNGDITPANIPRETNLEIFSVNNVVEYPIAKSSVVVPADAKGAIVVGAINSQNGKIESFSSQGPTNNGKLAPHVVGPDGVTTLAYKGNLFYGTSATTPYVAGLATLMLQDNQDVKPDELLQQIQSNTVKISDEVSNTFGYGSIDASFLITKK